MKILTKLIATMLFFTMFSPLYAASIKWSMPGDSLTLDPHAQNEGPTHMVSRQVYEGLVTRAIDKIVVFSSKKSRTNFPLFLENNRSKIGFPIAGHLLKIMSSNWS